jgi:hypothetical protein
MSVDKKRPAIKEKNVEPKILAGGSWEGEEI